jgi:hypothetical protein
MRLLQKFMILLSLSFPATGLPVSSFGRDEAHGRNGGGNQAQSRPNRMSRAQMNDQHGRPKNPDSHGQKDGKHERREHADRSRGNNFSFGYFSGAPAGGNGYTNNYYGYYQEPEYPYDMGYSDGFSAGRYDHLNGFMYNPRQYERGGNSDYFEGFVAGYRDGWSR